MPLRVAEPPSAVLEAAAAHVHQLASPRGVFTALRDAVREQLSLVAPHRMFTLGLDAATGTGLAQAQPSGWRYLVADRGRVVASAELADDAGGSPLLNAGPFVSSTAAAIDALERIPEVAEGDFEMTLLKVPALYVVAAWLRGDRALIVPLEPVPSFLQAGRAYTEDEFVSALQEPAKRISTADGPSGG